MLLFLSTLQGSSWYYIPVEPWELGCEESSAPKNWCFWTVVLEKTLESPLDCKEIHPVHSEGDQSWMFFGRNDAKAETPVLWSPHVKNWLIGKDSDAGRDRGQEEKGTTEDEIAGWHHQLDGHEFEWTLVVGDGQGGLACCNSWGRKESDTTEWLNWTELNWEPRQRISHLFDDNTDVKGAINVCKFLSIRKYAWKGSLIILGQNGQNLRWDWTEVINTHIFTWM